MNGIQRKPRGCQICGKVPCKFRLPFPASSKMHKPDPHPHPTTRLGLLGNPKHLPLSHDVTQNPSWHYSRLAEPSLRSPKGTLKQMLPAQMNSRKCAKFLTSRRIMTPSPTLLSTVFLSALLCAWFRSPDTTLIVAGVQEQLGGCV